jgi:pimeloyl-ACP methyl ester carboxylesterase
MHRKGDLAIPARFGKEFAAQLPNARMVLLEGSNHWMVTDPEDMDQVVTHIEEFLGQPGFVRSGIPAGPAASVQD